MASKQNLEKVPLPLPFLPIKLISNKTCLMTLKTKTKHRFSFTMNQNVSMSRLKNVTSSTALPSKVFPLNSSTSTIVLKGIFTKRDNSSATATAISSPSSCMTCDINKKNYNRKKLDNVPTNSWSSVFETIPSLTIRKKSLNSDEDVTAATDTAITIPTPTTTNSDAIYNRLESNIILPPTEQTKIKNYKTYNNCSVYDEGDAVLCKNKRKCLTYKKMNSTSLNHRKSDEVVKVFFIFYLIHMMKLWCRFLVGITACSRSLSRPLLQKTNPQKHQQIIELRKISSSSCTSSMPSSTLNMKKNFRLLPRVGTTSFCALITIICLETILLSTMSTCAKTFYMHWNTSNSIFRIDNTDHIIDVNKGNLAFEFDQVHIICPVYEPGTFDNATEKYIIYNVSKVEYETCRITNADPRVIAICDKPQKLMFFTITFRPFTPQPGGLEFLPGNDYYFISTSSKDDLYRRIGGRCTTNNMKVVFKVCCAPDEKNKTTSAQVATRGNDGINSGVSPGHSVHMGATDVSGSDGLEDSNMSTNVHNNNNKINMIGIKGVNTNTLPNGVLNIHTGGGNNANNNGAQINSVMNSLGGVGTAITTNIEQFNRIPIQSNNRNILGNTIGSTLGGTRNSMIGGNDGIILTHDSSAISMIPGGGNGGGISSVSDSNQYHPSHDYHGQSGIRINNVPAPHHTNYKNNDEHHYNKHPNEVVKNEELTYNSAPSVTLSLISRMFTINNDLASRNRKAYYIIKENTHNIMPLTTSYINIHYHKFLWHYFKLSVINFQKDLLPSFFLTNPMISSLLIVIIIQGILKHLILNNALPIKYSVAAGISRSNNNNNNQQHHIIQCGSRGLNCKNRFKSYNFRQDHSNSTTTKKCKILKSTR